MLEKYWKRRLKTAFKKNIELILHVKIGNAELRLCIRKIGNADLRLRLRNIELILHVKIQALASVSEYHNAGVRGKNRSFLH